MFQDDKLEEHLKTSSSISTNAKILAEWNMNVSTKIKQIGNYRYRPTDANSEYKSIATYFDIDDESNSYTGATDSDITIDGGYDETFGPITFVSKRQKNNLLFSLEDCLGKFRPRSGINKVLFSGGKYLHFPNIEMASRPRYYMADRTDTFKYWTSYREESGEPRGIANKVINGKNYIDDAAPYIVYEEPIPANRIVIKMQTNTGSIDFGVFTNLNESFSDPFYGYENQTTPVDWKIQYLNDGGDWIDAIAFNAASKRYDNTNIIGSDGYVEIAYGLVVPDDYRNNFRLQERTYASLQSLPDPTNISEGTAFLIKSNDYDKGRVAVVISTVYGNDYGYFNAAYGWYLEENDSGQIANHVSVLSDISNPNNNVVFKESTGKLEYRELKYISGIRIVVDTMNKFDSTLDIIEISPRIRADISDRVKSLSITKTASDIGISGLPVGQLLASTGSIELFDYDKSFFTSNDKSVIHDYLSQNVQLKIYETVLNVDGYDYQIPIKTMYSEGFPELSNTNRSATMQLRDLFFYMESLTAPQLFLQNVSLSSAVCTILDYIGFSNYVFKRNQNESEIIIPYFYVAPDKTVAEVLSDLAISAQASIFFDEDNNLVVMSRGYMLPSEDERSTDTTLYGSVDYRSSDVYRNQKTSNELANIIDIASQDTAVFNDGNITYTSSYIQKSYSSLKQANLVDRDKNWIYKPSLLWEVSPTEKTKSINEQLNQMSDYILTAMTLNSTLTKDVPSIVSGKVINNIIDFGDSVYWIGRYNGYFYANGEVIKYDAVEYSIPGLTDTDIESSSADGYNVWISSVQEYQKYFAKIPFNGKMYPTGRVRIFTELEYYTVGDNTYIKSVKKHGRGQFGTEIVEHYAGINPYWTTNADSLRGVKMENKYLFSTKTKFELSETFTEEQLRGSATIDEYPVNVKVTLAGSKIISTAHGLKTGDTVYLETTGQLPAQLDEKYIYFVTRLNDDEFSISQTSGGSPISVSGINSGYHSFVQVLSPNALSFDTQIEISETETLFTAMPLWLDTGDYVHLTTSGSLPTGVYESVIYQVGSIDHDTQKGKLQRVFGEDIEASGTQSGIHKIHKIKFPVTIGCPDHRFVSGDNLYLEFAEPGIGESTESWDFPDGINERQVFSVSDTGLTQDTVMLLGSNGEKVYINSSPQGQFNVSLSIDGDVEDYLNKRIVVPSLENIVIGMTVESISGTGAMQQGTKISSIDIDHSTIVLNIPVTEKLLRRYTNPSNGETVINIIRLTDRPSTTFGKAGITSGQEKNTQRTGVIKNSLSNSYLEDGQVNSQQFSTQSATVQSSAFIMHGSSAITDIDGPSILSYTYKQLDKKFVHFGTRMRIVGQFHNNEIRGQQAIGAGVYYTASPKSSDQTATISGASGGIAIMVDPDTNAGYYLELAALSETNLTKYASDSIHDVIFYKIQRDADPSTTNYSNAIPVKLWGGLKGINIDTGLFADQSRLTSSQDPSVYDVAIEYKEVGSSLMFQIFINGDIIATVYDSNPIKDWKQKNNTALFIRGGSRVMFENLHALACNYAENTVSSVGTLKDSVFGVGGDIDVSSAFNKYSLPGMVQSTYLTGISTNGAPDYDIFYEEFGTIFREAAHFDIRYDKAYPALTAKIAPTFNKNKGFMISGFTAGAYGAEFLVFNITDSVLSLDATSGNYLRILGVALTQQSEHQLTVDDFYSKKSSLSDPEFIGDSLIYSPVKVKKEYQDIKFSRVSNGRKEFSLNAPYIQTQDSANDLMDWITKKVMKPRKSIGIKIFAMPTLQLGDIVNIDYTGTDGSTEIAKLSDRFVIYSIEYTRSADSGPEMVIYLSEVK